MWPKGKRFDCAHSAVNDMTERSERNWLICRKKRRDVGSHTEKVMTG